ncbi:universal stress protein [Nitrospira defluvii]|uniref:Universal stress protein n=1 Tax=Nitrospira defluvii TaxID=330214 RepID=A0ABM8R927_9BACT|nr:universal stress protein [Nitrospira defluvii]CAE6740054.1 putative Universal stress protein [Nitrospira defluvii]
MKVVLAVDQPRDATIAARFLEVVRLPRGTALSVMHVIEVPHRALRFPGQQGMLADWRKESVMSARRLIDRLVPPLRAQGLRVRPVVKEGLPGPVLLDTAERMRTDLTILGPHGSSRLRRFLLGSVSELLLNEAPGSILIVRGRSRGRRDRGMSVVLAMDCSTDAKSAAGFLSKLRLPRGSHVILLHVEEDADRELARISGMGRVDLTQAVERAMRERKRRTLLMLERMGRKCAQQGLAVDHVFAEGSPAEAILSAAERHRADLIVMGSKGLTGIDRFLIGSVSRKVARHGPCSVLVVRKRRR